jgi:hypothetical protein
MAGIFYYTIAPTFFKRYLKNGAGRTKKAHQLLTLASRKVDGIENHRREAEETLLLSYLTGKIQIGDERREIEGTLLVIFLFPQLAT